MRAYGWAVVLAATACAPPTPPPRPPPQIVIPAIEEVPRRLCDTSIEERRQPYDRPTRARVRRLLAKRGQVGPSVAALFDAELVRYEAEWLPLHAKACERDDAGAASPKPALASCLRRANQRARTLITVIHDTETGSPKLPAVLGSIVDELAACSIAAPQREIPHLDTEDPEAARRVDVFEAVAFVSAPLRMTDGQREMLADRALDARRSRDPARRLILALSRARLALADPGESGPLKAASDAFNLARSQEDQLRAARALSLLGRAYALEGEPRIAFDTYERALNTLRELLGPAHPETIGTEQALAFAYHLSGGDPQDAIEFFTKRWGKEAPRLLEELARTYTLRGLYAEAKLLLKARLGEESITKAQRVRMLAAVALAAALEGDDELAMKYVLAVARQVDALLSKRRTKERKKTLAFAERSLRVIASRYALSPRSREDQSIAVEVADIHASAFPDASTDVLITLGDLLHHVGRDDDARARYEQAAELAPTSAAADAAKAALRALPSE